MKPLPVVVSAILAGAVVAWWSAPDHVAEFEHRPSKTTIRIELDQMHPYLAEYHRVLVADFGGWRGVEYELSDDTGGYAAANLYACPNGVLMLDSYGEFVVVDSASARIREGRCAGTPEYLGVFDGSSREHWQFFDALARPEEALAMKGG